MLVIRTGALGDTLVALPAIAALRRRFEVEACGVQPAADLMRGPGLASAVHSVDGRVFSACFAESADDRALMRLLANFDRVVSWARLPLLASKLAGTHVRLVTGSARPPARMHASDHLVETLRPLGIDAPGDVPLIGSERSDSETRTDLDLLGLVPGKFVAIHPSSGSRAKNWPAERFAHVARLAREDGFGLLWLEGEPDAAIVGPLAASYPAPIARQWGLRRLASVLSQSALVVGNDSGISHLSAAAGAATVAVFRHTDPRQWAPLGPRVRVERGERTAAELWGGATEWLEGASQ